MTQSVAAEWHTWAVHQADTSTLVFFKTAIMHQVASAWLFCLHDRTKFSWQLYMLAFDIYQGIHI